MLKGRRVESTEAARKEYAELLGDGWKKTNILRSILRIKAHFPRKYVITLEGCIHCSSKTKNF